jgi:plasmid stabilization system protein ParE
MPIKWSQQAEDSLFEILKYYEEKEGVDFADSIEDRIFEQVDKIEGFEMSIPESDIYPQARKLVIRKLPYVAFIRQNNDGEWEVIDITHTSMKTPKANWY